MISGSIICGNSIGSTGGIDIIAVKSILSAGKCSITCGSAGGDGLIVERSQCDGSASDGNLTAGSTSCISFITESASLTTGSAGGVGGGCGVGGVGGVGGGGGCGGGGVGGVGVGGGCGGGGVGGGCVGSGCAGGGGVGGV